MLVQAVVCDVGAVRAFLRSFSPLIEILKMRMSGWIDGGGGREDGLMEDEWID